MHDYVHYTMNGYSRGTYFQYRKIVRPFIAIFSFILDQSPGPFFLPLQ